MPSVGPRVYTPRGAGVGAPLPRGQNRAGDPQGYWVEDMAPASQKYLRMRVRVREGWGWEEMGKTECKRERESAG